MNDIHPYLKSVDKRKLICGNTEPLTSWYQSYQKADLIHNHFLQNHKKYTLKIDNIIWNSRISINFFGARFKFIKYLYRLFYERENKMDDEAFYAWICKAHNLYHVIVPRFVVTHFSYGPQNNLLLENKYISEYYKLANNTMKQENQDEQDSFLTSEFVM